MKKNLTILTLTLAIIIGAGCTPEDLKPYTPVANGDVNGLFGTWKGTSVIQRDVSAESKGFPYKNEDMTTALAFTNVKVTLNGSASAPTTFAIDYGSAPNFFKFNSGNWKVDNPEKVGKVYLINATGTDTITMTMGSYQEVLNNQLSLVQTKTLLGQPAIIYEYKFSK
jgi:hypothetical protein